MKEIVYIDGVIYRLEEARIDLLSKRIFNGVFESLIVVNEKVFKLEEHLKRLFNSAKVLKIIPPLDYFHLKEVVLATLKESRLKNAYLRISIIQREEKNNLIILVKKALVYPEEFFTQGVNISFVSNQRNIEESLTPRVKCSNFLANVLAKNEIISKNNFEVISLNSKGLITEGTISNVFMVSGGIVYTPKKSLGILEGVTRKVVIDICKDLNIKIKEEFLTKYDIYTAEEVFLTFSSAGVLPVAKVDGRIIGEGKAGKITEVLLQEYRKRLHKN